MYRDFNGTINGTWIIKMHNLNFITSTAQSDNQTSMMNSFNITFLDSFEQIATTLKNTTKVGIIDCVKFSDECGRLSTREKTDYLILFKNRIFKYMSPSKNKDLTQYAQNDLF